MDWFHIGKGACQGCILSPFLFNLYAEYIMQNARLDEAQAGIKTVGKNINNLRYGDDTTLMAESEEELRSLLMKVKQDNEKVGLKLNIQRMKLMAPGLITSWQIDGATMETVTDFIFLGSTITADGDCSHEIKWHLFLGRKAMINLDNILKSRDLSSPTSPPSQSYGFSSSHKWMWELDYKESWVLKNWCFWTVVLEKTLESPLDCKEIKPVNPEGNQSWIFIGRTDAEAEAQAPILWPPDARNGSLEKTLMLGKTEGRRRRGWQRMRWLDGITDSMDMSLRVSSRSWWWMGKPGMLQSMGSWRVRHYWVTVLNCTLGYTLLLGPNYKWQLVCFLICLVTEWYNLSG